MVRTCILALFVLALAVPAMAQDDFPRVETSLGYGNLAFPNIDGSTGHHSGFAMFNGLNLTRWLGIDNFTGIYGLGEGVTMFSNVVGGKVMYRTSRLVPYAVAGLGGSYISQGSSYGSAFTSRLGGGVDVPLGDSFSLKFDVSRLSLRSGGWLSNTNFATGITFNLN